MARFVGTKLICTMILAITQSFVFKVLEISTLCSRIVKS